MGDTGDMPVGERPDSGSPPGGAGGGADRGADRGAYRGVNRGAERGTDLGAYRGAERGVNRGADLGAARSTGHGADLAPTLTTDRGTAPGDIGQTGAPVAPVAVVLHDDLTDIDWLTAILRSRLLPVTFVRPYAGDQLPDPADVAGVILMGGPQHAHRSDRPAYLDAESDFLSRSLAGGLPVLGICLGSQLLAEALGGRAVPGSRGPECGPIHVEIDPDADEPVLDGLSGMYFSLHEDSFDLPPGARVLARSDRYPQAFRLGSALGVQFHPEISPAGIARYAAAAPGLFHDAGIDTTAMLNWAKGGATTAWRRADTLLGAWAEHAIGRGPQYRRQRHESTCA